MKVEATEVDGRKVYSVRAFNRGIATWLVHLNPGVLAAVQLSSLGTTLGRGRMFFNLEEALAAWRALHAADQADGASETF